MHRVSGSSRLPLQDCNFVPPPSSMSSSCPSSTPSSGVAPPPPQPRKSTKSLGVRKHHHQPMRGNMTPVMNGGITAFFKKSTLDPYSLHSSPSPSPESSPPQTIQTLMQQTTTKPQQHIPSRAPSPLPSFESLLPSMTDDSSVSTMAGSSMWSDTPPTESTMNDQPMTGVTTRAPPNAPNRNGKKSLPRSTSPELRTLLQTADDDEEEAAPIDHEEGDAIIPFKLNLCSQPSQNDTNMASITRTNALVFDDADAPMVDSSSSSVHALQRSSSACSDIVIQASQEMDDERTPAESPCSTPRIEPMATPNQTPGGSPIKNLPAGLRPMEDSAPPQIIHAPPQRSLNPFALGPARHFPVPAGSSAALSSFSSTPTDMPPPPPVSGLDRRLRRAGSTLAPPTRQASFTALTPSQNGGGLPPHAPPRTNSSTLRQTTLAHHLVRSASINNSQAQCDTNDTFQLFGPVGSQLSQTQCLASQSSACGLESVPSNSMFCTPQDQPIRERTAFEMAEELQLQREHLAWDHARIQQQQQQQQQHSHLHSHLSSSPLVNTHAPLTASMRHGTSGHSNSGLHAPPALKKQRFTLTESSAGVIGSNHEEQLQPTQVTHTTMTTTTTTPMMTSCGPPSFYSNAPAPPDVNPFLAAWDAATARLNGTAPPSNGSNSSSSSRSSKKRVLDSNGVGGGGGVGSLNVPQHSRLFHDFEYLKQFGLGSFGLVYLVRHRLEGQLYAIKKSKSKIRGVASRKLMLREIQILCFLNSRYDCPRSILRYLNSWIEEGHLYIQTEWCPGGSLASILKKRGNNGGGGGGGGSVDSSTMTTPTPTGAFSNSTLTLIALQLSHALSFMHSHGLVHLDIKPDNILELVQDQQYCLADFGLACSSSDGSSAVLSVGDKRYLPCEALEDDITDLKGVDLFALGCTLYELSSGKPFELPMSQMEMTRIRNGDIDDVAQTIEPTLYEIIRVGSTDTQT